MWLRRFLALLVAVGLVLGAVVVRDRFLGGGAVARAPADLRIACVRALALACQDPRVFDTLPTVEDAAATVDRLAGVEPGVDVWLTLAPWAEMAANARAAAGTPELASATSDVLARSPVLLAARTDRLAPLEDACGQELTWPCVAARAGQPWADIGGETGWGDVKVGLHRPGVTADGLLSLTQASAAFLDDRTFNTRSLADPSYFAWLSELADETVTPSAVTPFEQMLLTGAADVEFAAVLEGVAVPLLRRAPDRAADIELLGLGPPVTADVVAVAYGEGGADAVERVGRQLADALLANGWRTPDGGGGPSELASLTVPPDNALPSPAALEALRRTWLEVVR